MEALLRVALPVPLRRVFTYRAPDGWQGSLPAPGVRVIAPFAGRELTGWVVGHCREAEVGVRLLPLCRILDAEPVLDADTLELCGAMARYYLAPPGEVVRAVAPPAGPAPDRQIVDWVGPGAANELFPHAQEPERTLPGGLQRRVVRVLRERGSLSVGALARAVERKQIRETLRSLQKRGWVKLRRETKAPVAARKIRTLRLVDPTRTERLGPKGRELVRLLERAGGGAQPAARLVREWGFAEATLQSLVRWGAARLEALEVTRRAATTFEPRDDQRGLRPTPAQSAAIEEIAPGLGPRAGQAYLLHGVTGSGKTLVYLELCERALALGQGVLILVPEIALVGPLQALFESRFPGQCAILHSALAAGERRDAWYAAQSGLCRIVIGARSAVFAPLPELGLILIDEEHESAYKGSGSFPYHARTVAEHRARSSKATLVYGSATPCMETYQRARSGELILLQLPTRIDDRPLPKVRLVNMLTEAKPGQAISPSLRRAIQARLERDEQIILLLNRRGYSPAIQCGDCGQIPECRDCSVRLTYHKQDEALHCHYCGSAELLPAACPDCGAERRRFRGWGTQRVEEEIARLFPSVKVLRMDQDATRKKGAHATILQAFARGEAELLLGTQMVAKGLDFPRVTLVGVINADIGLSIADFRAGERSFQLLTQVSGRAGRGEVAGEVLVQSQAPRNYAIQHALRHDFEGFFATELKQREELWYPPFSSLIAVLVRSRQAGAAQRYARELAEALQSASGGGFTVLGPAETPVARVQGEHRQQIIVKAAASERGRLLVFRALGQLPPPSGVAVGVDIDPAHMA